MKKPLKVIISGGGTGGHIFPALAIAQSIRSRFPDALIHFVGALGKMEMEKIPAAGFDITGLPITGFQRKLSFSNLVFPFKLIRSLWLSRVLLKRFRPDVVIGVGGFASGPLLEMACRMKIRSLIHESNSYPGITNRILGPKVDKICVAFEHMNRYFPESKLILTGNPVREQILSVGEDQMAARKFFGLHPNKPVALIVGGSLGARTINHCMERGWTALQEAGFQLIWQTGKSYESKSPMDAGIRTAFIERMDMAYTAADVVVSRAGAMSVTEICIVGKPAILVPSPNVAEDHQTRNAMSLVDKDAAILVKDNEAPEKLIPELITLLSNPERQKNLSNTVRLLAIPDATERILKEVMHLIPEHHA